MSDVCYKKGQDNGEGRVANRVGGGIVSLIPNFLSYNGVQLYHDQAKRKPLPNYDMRPLAVPQKRQQTRETYKY